LTAIKAAIENGEDVQGYKIETINNLQIKWQKKKKKNGQWKLHRQ
jgi:hypothetical protein